MKGQYIRQVEKELRVSRKIKREILRDLEEAFASALEHGEGEAQVIQRLGTPKEFADNAAAQFGVDLGARKKRRGIVAGAAALAAALMAFGLYGAARLQRPPAGAIGQADAMTGIQVTGGLGIDFSALLLAAGAILACAALLCLVGALRKNRR